MDFGILFLLEIVFMFINYFQSIFSVNVEILGTMLAQACCHFNFAYVIYVMNMVKHEEIKPNQIFMNRLKRFNNTIKDLMKKRVSINFRKKLS